jgi:hypothetical protein
MCYPTKKTWCQSSAVFRLFRLNLQMGVKLDLGNLEAGIGRRVGYWCSSRSPWVSGRQQAV